MLVQSDPLSWHYRIRMATFYLWCACWKEAGLRRRFWLEMFIRFVWSWRKHRGYLRSRTFQY